MRSARPTDLAFVCSCPTWRTCVATDAPNIHGTQEVTDPVAEQEASLRAASRPCPLCARSITNPCRTGASNPHSAVKDTVETPPGAAVTPEVAGSSPVAPARHPTAARRRCRAFAPPQSRFEPQRFAALARKEGDEKVTAERFARQPSRGSRSILRPTACGSLGALGRRPILDDCQARLDGVAGSLRHE
jgi:hypothetical protein